MFKEMKRKDKSLPEQEMLEIMREAEYGVLSTVGADGYPYGVPVNFVYRDETIYFHSAVSGHKLDNIADNSRVSFCVVCDVENLPSEFNTKFRSVIAFGEARQVEDDKKNAVLEMLISKYSKDFYESGLDYIKKAGGAAKVYGIEVQHMTSKGKK